MKNFHSLPKQEKYLLISNIAAIIFAFFPAVYAPIIGSISLVYGADGKLTLLALVLSILLILFREEIFAKTKMKNEKLPLFIVAGIFSLVLIRIIYIWQKMVFMPIDKENPFAEAFAATVGTGIGLYLTFFAVLFGISCIFCFSKVENICDIVIKKFVKSENSENNNKTEEKTLLQETQK